MFRCTNKIWISLCDMRLTRVLDIDPSVSLVSQPLSPFSPSRPSTATRTCAQRWIGSWVTCCHSNCCLLALGPGTACCLHFINRALSGPPRLLFTLFSLPPFVPLLALYRSHASVLHSSFLQKKARSGICDHTLAWLSPSDTNWKEPNEFSLQAAAENKNLKP